MVVSHCLSSRKLPLSALPPAAAAAASAGLHQAAAYTHTRAAAFSIWARGDTRSGRLATRGRPAGTGTARPPERGRDAGGEAGKGSPNPPGSGRDGGRGRGSRPARHLAASPATALLAAAGKAAPLPARAAVCSPAPRRALRPPPAPPRASPPRARANGLREGAERGGSRGSRPRGGSWGGPGPLPSVGVFGFAPLEVFSSCGGTSLPKLRLRQSLDGLRSW